MKDIYTAKTKLLDFEDGERLIVVLNEHEADLHGINAFDKVELTLPNKEKITVDANLSQHKVQPGEIGIFEDVYKKYKMKKDEKITIHFTQRSNTTIEAIRKKVQGKKISYEETYSIIKDISENKLTDTLMTYYVASSFAHPTTNTEMFQTAKAMAETGVTFKYPKEEIVADKHCIGGVPGNETSMIIIPTVASLGIKMPKNFSKAITSPAATGECVNVLSQIVFTKDQIKEIIKENNACLVRGGGLDLAPADDKIIRVSYPLSMQNIAKVVSSIMAKKYAMGITHSLIDIPMGPTAKVKDLKEAKIWKKKFEYVGKKLGMKMSVQITQAPQPIGKGIGAVMQVREVLRVLQQHTERPEDLEQKAMFLSAKIIEIAGLAKGQKALDLAYEQLRSGASWKKMQELIKTQNGFDTPSKEDIKDVKRLGAIKSEELPLAKISYEYKTTKSGTVKDIDMKYLNGIARTLGCPLSQQAGLYLDKKMGDIINENETIFTLYSNDQNKIDMVLDMLKEKNIYQIK